MLEQEIQFRKGPTSRLGDSEISIDDAKEANASPKETSIISPIPRAWIQHVRGENITYDAHDVVKVPPKYDGLDLQSACR
jgi:hypothetical protein